MNILCNEGGFVGDLGIPRGKLGYEGDWSKMGERWQLCNMS